MIEVKIGQLWRSKDPRDKGKIVKVTNTGFASSFAWIQKQPVINRKACPCVRISQDGLRKRYELVEEPKAETAHCGPGKRCGKRDCGGPEIDAPGPSTSRD